MNRSYGLFIAEMLNFPIEIIEDWKQKAKELEKFKDQYDEDIKANEVDEINKCNIWWLEQRNDKPPKSKALSKISKFPDAFKNYKNGNI